MVGLPPLERSIGVRIPALQPQERGLLPLFFFVHKKIPPKPYQITQIH